VRGFFSQASQDTDGDLIGDDFERHYGLNPHDASDALLDLDLDGLSNLEEYRLGTCPESVFSFFRVEAEPESDGAELGLRWMSRPGNRYVVEQSNQLTLASWQSVVAEVVAPEGVAVTEATIPVPLEARQGFYRVRLLSSSVPTQ